MTRELFEMVGRRASAPALDDVRWRELLAFADRTQLTLYLRGNPGLPGWLVEEIESRYAKNAVRRSRLLAAYAETADALSAAGVEFVLLKGFTHEGGFGTDGSARIQYDLDLLTQPGELERARTVFERIGYKPHGRRSLSEEHSRPLVRPSDWTWRGDYYDPEMPIPVELHRSVWNSARDHIHPDGIEAFWQRRSVMRVTGLEIPALAELDRFAFAALHVLRHILRHDARPAHVLELARFLNAYSGDGRFWDRWRGLHSSRLRALQAVAFRFAQEWFGCAVPVDIEQTESAEAWFREFAWSPVANLTEPNKDTIWLHMELVRNWRDRVCVFCDRMIPLRLPQHERMLDRLRYHAWALAPALANGVRWRWRRKAASTASQISDWKRRRV
jgi:hypothetical protein